MKQVILCFLLLFVVVGISQEGEDKKAPEKAVETEEQQNIRSVSLRDLEDADEKLNLEREAIAKRKRRIEQLLEALTNQTATIQSKHDDISKMIEDVQKNKIQETLPLEQINHWESRDPKVAAKDFMLLFESEPKVAVTLMKRMKKKKSAALLDEVAVLKGGPEVASRIHEAIGTGFLKEN